MLAHARQGDADQAGLAKSVWVLSMALASINACRDLNPPE
jgi:hypothetical protein